MSKIKNGGLNQYGAKRFRQKQSGTAGTERFTNTTNTGNYCGTAQGSVIAIIFKHLRTTFCEDQSSGSRYARRQIDTQTDRQTD